MAQLSLCGHLSALIDVDGRRGSTIARVRCPMLLVHGADDDVVPLGDARQILAARTHEGVELRVLGGDHDSFANLEQRMEQLVGFLRLAREAGTGDAASARARAEHRPRSAAHPTADTRG